MGLVPSEYTFLHALVSLLPSKMLFEIQNINKKEPQVEIVIQI